MSLRVTVQGMDVEVKALRVGFPNGPHFFDDLVLGHAHYPPFANPVSSGLPGNRFIA
jgi:hypothetical protein